MRQLYGSFIPTAFGGAAVLICITFAVVSLVLFDAPSARATAFLSPYLMKYSDSRPDEQLGMYFFFTANGTIPTSSRLQFGFNGLDVPAVTSTDADLWLGGATQTVANTAAPGIFGYSATSGYLYLETPPDLAIATGTQFTFIIGQDGAWRTPSTTGVFSFSTTVLNAGTTLGSNASFMAILEPTEMSADVPTGTRVTIQWAVPELRAGPPGTNDDALFFLTARTGGTVLSLTDVFASTSASGTFFVPIDLAVASGTYDIGFKGHQHLTKVLRNVPLSPDFTRVLNFSQTDYTSTTKGAVVLLGGDINGTTTSPALMGDDKVNAVDLTQLLSQFNATDTSGNTLRPDINQDTKVNAVDLTIILKNFNLIGDI